MVIDWTAVLDEAAEEAKAAPLASGEQASLFGSSRPVSLLREYQVRASESCIRDLDEVGSSLLVMATGLGKTEVMCEVIRRWQHGPVLCLAHRDELVEQLRDRIELRTHERPYIEKADSKAPPWARVVVASIDTIKTKKRLERWAPDYFSLLLIDEVHHYVGNTYVRPFRYFEAAKRLGVTATPKRLDKRALGQWFESVAMMYDITSGIRDGFLVPVRSENVTIKSINLKRVKVSGGDFQRGALDEEMLKGIAPIVDDVLLHHPTEQAIVFFPGIKTAEAACERFNVAQPESTCFISGKTPKDERRRLVAEFKAGRLRRLCNCQIATEGFDAPNVSLIVLARPTKSLTLATQMIGRGTRVTPGLIDHLPEDSQADERRRLIAESPKPHVTILDFRGVCSPAMLQTPTDVLGGMFSDEERALAKKKQRAKPGTDVIEALEAARRELREQLRSVASETQTVHSSIDLFAICKVSTDSLRFQDQRAGFTAMTHNQRVALEKFGCAASEIDGLSMRGASRMLKELSKRARLLLATVRQVKWLARHGLCETNITFAAASQAIDWGKKQLKAGRQLDAGQLAAVAAGIRPPVDLVRPSSTSTE